jgi:hypothetical protein
VTPAAFKDTTNGKTCILTWLTQKVELFYNYALFCIFYHNSLSDLPSAKRGKKYDFFGGRYTAAN